MLHTYLYDEIWWGNIARQGAEVDPHSPFLMGCEFRIIFVIQGDSRQGPSDGSWVTRVNIFEND